MIAVLAENKSKSRDHTFVNTALGRAEKEGREPKGSRKG